MKTLNILAGTSNCLRKRYATLTILTWMSISGSGQADFRSAFYLNHELDTIYGEIDYRGDKQNTRLCVFRKSKDGPVLRFEPGDISAYRFIGGKYYISKWIQSEDEEKMIFAEYLVNGIAKLYYYRDMLGDHYLIENREGHLVELTNESKVIEKDGLNYSLKGYQQVGLLKASFSDCEEIQPEIDRAVLSHKSLISITENYHNYVCEDEKCIVYQKEIPAVRVNISPTLGISATDLKLSTSGFYEKFDFHTSFAPTIGLLINLEAPRLNEKLSFQIEMDLVKNNFTSSYEESRSTGSIYMYDATANTTSIRSMLALKYRYPRGSVKPALALGPQFNYLLDSDFSYALETPWNYSEFEDTPMSDKTVGWFVLIGADFKINKKITAFSNLKFSNTASTPSGYTKLQSATLNMGVFF